MGEIRSATSDGEEYRDGAKASAAPQAEEDREIVHHELRHRFRNIIAVTQSLVNQTLRDGVTITAARDTLNHHLAAMGGALDLLLRTDWQPSSLHTTIQEALAYPIDFRDRIVCKGPEVAVGSGAVMALTLAFHELQTNAIKYGALSSSAGMVDLFWKIVDSPTGQRLWLQWAEHGGPTVARPTRQGTGTQLISRATQRALGGDIQVEYTPSGLTWFLLAPLERVAS